MRIAYHVMSTPLGLVFVARSERGLRHVEFMDRRSLKRIIESHAEEAPGAKWEPSLFDLRDPVEQLEAYFSGALNAFDVKLDPQGSEFQHAVWNALLEIPYGRTRTYGEIARAIGQPKAARAVGLANNQNPIAVVIPCHRVIGADGSLTGYGGGLPRKRWLLELENRVQRLDLGLTEPALVAASPKPAPAGGAKTVTAKAAGGKTAPTPPRTERAATTRPAMRAPARKAAATGRPASRRAPR